MIVFAALVADSKPELYNRISYQIAQKPTRDKNCIHQPPDLFRRGTAPAVQADFRRSFLVFVEQTYSVESSQSSWLLVVRHGPKFVPAVKARRRQS